LDPFLLVFIKKFRS